MMVNTNSTMAADDNTRPGRSTAAAPGSLEVGTATATKTAAAAATGAIAMKMAAQGITGLDRMVLPPSLVVIAAITGRRRLAWPSCRAAWLSFGRRGHRHGRAP